MALSRRSIERVSCRLSGRPDTDPTWRPPLISNPGGNRPQRSGCNLHDNNARPDRPFRALNVFRHPLETFLLVTDFLDAADVAAGAPSGPRNQGGRRKVSGASSYPACSLEDLAMRYDWTPLWRSTIGFDHLFDVLDEVQRTAEETYPRITSSGSTRTASKSRWRSPDSHRTRWALRWSRMS